MEHYIQSRSLRGNEYSPATAISKLACYSDYKKLKKQMKKLKKMKHDLQHPGQALKHKLQPDAYKQAKHKVHQVQNPGQTLKHKLQPEAYKKAKRRLKKLSKLKKMLKGEVRTAATGVCVYVGEAGGWMGVSKLLSTLLTQRTNTMQNTLSAVKGFLSIFLVTSPRRFREEELPEVTDSGFKGLKGITSSGLSAE